MALFLEGFHQKRYGVLKRWLLKNAEETEQVPHVIKWLISERELEARRAEYDRACWNIPAKVEKIHKKNFGVTNFPLIRTAGIESLARRTTPTIPSIFTRVRPLQPPNAAPFTFPATIRDNVPSTPAQVIAPVPTNTSGIIGENGAHIQKIVLNTCTWKERFIFVPGNTLQITDTSDHVIDEIKRFVCRIFNSRSVNYRITESTSKAIETLKKYYELGEKTPMGDTSTRQATVSLDTPEVNRKKTFIIASERFRNLINFYKKYPDSHPILMALFLEVFRLKHTSILRNWLLKNTEETEQVPPVIKWLVTKRSTAKLKGEHVKVKTTVQKKKRKTIKKIQVFDVSKQDFGLGKSEKAPKIDQSD
jgi:hypothetical protein